jgi:cobalt/nickel transport protein
MRNEILKTDNPSVKWFDGFTRAVLLTMFILLAFIFISAKYMSSHKMEAGGTDDVVNTMASKVTGSPAHAFLDLPGDAQVGAFSVANLCVGLIVGHLWTSLFGKNAEQQRGSRRKDEEE